MQGGPGKSSLFGQFLENGPLGMDATGHLFRRRPSILSTFNVVYLDAPAGSGYSFDTTGTYPSTLEESSVHTIRFLRRFLRIFPEYKNREFFIAGESYGGGPGKSARYGQFLENGPLGIDVEGKLFRRRPSILSDFNVVYLDAPAGSGYSFSKVGRYPLTLEEAAEHTMRFMKGFLRIFPEYKDTYFFIAGESYGGDFFIDKTQTLADVLNNVHVLFYTAQLDAVFPSVNMERAFMKKSLVTRLVYDLTSTPYVKVDTALFGRNGNE
ncbi:hypothetical protein HPB52_020785 [Rhipicephalus sanguineus]|uniref:Carboxypeptidase n=1 Tax=Rhipicephalus sanguineus TaxID=34632 RepID=A0A9D4T6Q6_RHISA|nr:hypothetical protein HPB52_020785 [Rhipicephalus sanguineus]